MTARPMTQETWDTNGNLIERVIVTDVDSIVVEFRTDDPDLLALLPGAGETVG